MGTALPSNGLEPFQEPEAVQVFAFVVDQVKAAALPATICKGSTPRVTVTGGVVVEDVTRTEIVLALLPPAPEQVSVYE